MRNIIGNNLTLTIFGESHGEKIGIVIDGLCAGIKIDNDYIKECLSKRRPSNSGETKRVESDNYNIISGVFNGYSTGSSICVLIDNINAQSKDYEKTKDLLRPSHADYAAYEKYHGYNDYRGGGHFSGRITASIVLAGSILLKALENLDIKIACHIKQIGNVKDRSFNDLAQEIDILNEMNFPVLDDVSEEMLDVIEQAKNDNDSIGGIVETAIINLPVGLGEPMFSSLESELSKAMFSIGGIKGIEFGLGFGFAEAYGSEVNDSFTVENDHVSSLTNNNGGINGGISNGMPVIFSCAIKPTPSIGKVQQTVNIKSRQKEEIKIVGRHDPCIVRRISIIIRSMAAFVIADMLITKYGTDVFLKKK